MLENSSEFSYSHWTGSDKLFAYLGVEDVNTVPANKQLTSD
jgi:hypothetical protein